MDCERAAYVLAVIASRAGDVLDAVTLAEIEAALWDKPAAPIMLPAEIAARIEAVLGAIEEQLAAMRARLAAMEEAALERRAEDERRTIEDAFVNSASVETRWQ